MGMDAISLLACAAARPQSLEKKAGLGQPIGKGLDWAAKKLFMGKNGLSLGKALGVGGAGIAGADALSGMSGGWEGQGGMNWHPWGDPKNWASNIFLHPLRSLNEAMGKGSAGDVSKDIPIGPATYSMEGNQRVKRMPVHTQFAPSIMREQERILRMKQEYEQGMKRLQSLGVPGFGGSTPDAGVNPPSRWEPKRVDYNALSPNYVF